MFAAVKKIKSFNKFLIMQILFFFLLLFFFVFERFILFLYVPLFFGLTSYYARNFSYYKFNIKNGKYSIPIDNDDKNQLYWISFFMFCFAIPMGIFIFVYISIGLSLSTILCIHFISRNHFIFQIIHFNLGISRCPLARRRRNAALHISP